MESGDIFSGADPLSWTAIGVLATFAFASTWTPGPNNMMLASSGATYGFQRTIPHALGVAFGFPLMFFAVALGFDSVLVYAETRLVELHPAFGHARRILALIAAGVLVWFGLRIALARPPKSGEADAFSRPFTFIEAAAFQWINPKAWAMAIGAATLYLPGASPIVKASVGALVFVCAGLTSAHSWAAFGAALRRALQSELRLRIFNGVMGALVIGSVAFLFLD